jgi:cell cycle arrest protein BUB2
MNEVDAFYSFQRFITRVCPAYFKAGEMAGVHAGCELIDEILATVDPELAKTLPEGRQWAFECVCALSLNSQPLTEALHLYDFFIAFGLHYSIIFTVAQALIIRDELMKGGNLQKKLKDMSLSIDAKKIISVGCHIVGMIGEETYRKLVRNSVDIDVARSIVVVANERRKKTKSETDRQLSPIINHNQRNFTSPIMKEAQKINRSRTKQK